MVCMSIPGWHLSTTLAIPRFSVELITQQLSSLLRHHILQLMIQRSTTGNTVTVQLLLDTKRTLCATVSLHIPQHQSNQVQLAM